MCNSGQRLQVCQKAQKSMPQKKNKVFRTAFLDIILTTFTVLAIMPCSKLLIRTRLGLDPQNIPFSATIYITAPSNTTQSLKIKTYIL